MEHRWYPRQTLVRAALLYQQGALLGRCQIADVSRDGLSVTIPGIKLPRGCCVELLFDECTPETPRCAALVVHESGGRLGLMWMGANPFSPAPSDKLLTTEGVISPLSPAGRQTRGAVHGWRELVNLRWRSFEKDGLAGALQ